jgi:hypothetical protein
MGVALHLYHDAHGCFPSGYIYDASMPFTKSFRSPTVSRAQWVFDGWPPPAVIQQNGPGWSWVALMLPFIEQTGLHAQVNFHLRVEHAQNAAIRLQEPSLVTCPSDYGAGRFNVLNDLNVPLADAATSSYAACFGSYNPAAGDLILISTDPDHGNGMFHRNSHVKHKDVEDGLTYTIAVGERAALFAKSPWAGVMTSGTVRTTPGAPVFISMVELAPTMVMARAGKTALNNPYSEPYDFFSAHRQIVHFLYADGSVRPLSSSTEHAVFHAHATRRGGEAAGDSI